MVILHLRRAARQEETRLVKFRFPGKELPLELVDTPQPKNLFRNFRQIFQNHRDQTVASVTTAEGLYRVRYRRYRAISQ